VTRTPQVPGGFAEPYARYRRSAHGAPAPRSWAVESAIADLERALCRDRCHAVVEAPLGSTRALLLRTLAERLRAAYRVVQVPSSAREGEICARILAALGESPGRDAEVRLLSVLYEIGSRGSALVVLIDEAGALSAASLRRLGRLASVARPDLRLALIVTAQPGSEAIGRVVAGLGVSAEKVTLAPRAERPPARLATAPPSDAPAAPATPRAAARARRARAPIRVAARRLGERARRGRRTVALLLGGAVALLFLQQVSGPPTGVSGPGAEPQASAVSAPPAKPAPTPAEKPSPAPPQGPVEAVRVTAMPAALAPDPAAAEALPAALPAAAPIRVSLNARPWARIEVDGREIGVTPLAEVPIAPGLHHFRARLADGRVIERSVRVDAYRDRIVFP